MNDGIKLDLLHHLLLVYWSRSIDENDLLCAYDIPLFTQTSLHVLRLQRHSFWH